MEIPFMWTTLSSQTGNGRKDRNCRQEQQARREERELSSQRARQQERELPGQPASQEEPGLPSRKARGMQLRVRGQRLTVQQPEEPLQGPVQQEGREQPEVWQPGRLPLMVTVL